MPLTDIRINGCLSYLHLLVKSDMRPEKRECAMRSALKSDAPNNVTWGNKLVDHMEVMMMQINNVRKVGTVRLPQNLLYRSGGLRGCLGHWVCWLGFQRG